RWNFSSLGSKNPSAPEHPSGTAASPRNGAAQKSSNSAKPSAQETAPAEKGSSAEKTSTNPMNLSIGKLNVYHGRMNVSKADSTQPQRVYNEVNIAVKNFSFSSSFPFDMTANLPSGGTMKLTGTAGPIDANDAALTPLNAKINVQNMKLAASGFIDLEAGLQGLADLHGTLGLNWNKAKANGTLT